MYFLPQPPFDIDSKVRTYLSELVDAISFNQSKAADCIFGDKNKLKNNNTVTISGSNIAKYNIFVAVLQISAGDYTSTILSKNNNTLSGSFTVNANGETITQSIIIKFEVFNGKTRISAYYNANSLTTPQSPFEITKIFGII